MDSGIEGIIRSLLFLVGIFVLAKLVTISPVAGSVFAFFLYAWAFGALKGAVLVAMSWIFGFDIIAGLAALLVGLLVSAYILLCVLERIIGGISDIFNKEGH